MLTLLLALALAPPQFEVTNAKPEWHFEVVSASETQQAVETVKEQKNYFIYFKKKRCDMCDVMAAKVLPVIRNAGYAVVELDVDYEQKWVDKYGITLCPTIILLDGTTREQISPSMVGKHDAAKLIELAGQKPVAKTPSVVEQPTPVVQSPTIVQPKVVIQPPVLMSQPQYSRNVSRVFNVNGDWSPSREKMIRHLLTDPNHAGRHSSQSLESMSDQDLANLHDQDHGSFRTMRYSSGSMPNVFNNYGTRRNGFMIQSNGYRTYNRGNCPNGMCPR